MAQVRAQLLTIAVAADNLPPPDAELSEDEIQSAEKQRTLITNNLLACEQFLDNVQIKYGLTNEERQTLLALYVQKHAELQQLKAAHEAAVNKANEVKSNSTKPPEKVEGLPPNRSANLANPPTATKANEADATSAASTNSAPK